VQEQQQLQAGIDMREHAKPSFSIMPSIASLLRTSLVKKQA
jgi:hypothetical protein